MENFERDDTLEIFTYIEYLSSQFKDKINAEMAFLKNHSHLSQMQQNYGLFMLFKNKTASIQFTTSTDHHKLPSFNLSYVTFHIQVFFSHDLSSDMFFEQHSLQMFFNCIYYKKH